MQCKLYKNIFSKIKRGKKGGLCRNVVAQATQPPCMRVHGFMLHRDRGPPGWNSAWRKINMHVWQPGRRPVLLKEIAKKSKIKKQDSSLDSSLFPSLCHCICPWWNATVALVVGACGSVWGDGPTCLVRDGQRRCACSAEGGRGQSVEPACLLHGIDRHASFEINYYFFYYFKNDESITFFSIDADAFIRTHTRPYKQHILDRHITCNGKNSAG
jgi:hypothetical protein